MSLSFLKTCLARMQNDAKKAFCSSTSSMSWVSGFLAFFIRTSFPPIFLLSSTSSIYTSLSCCHCHSLPHSIPLGETRNFQFQAFNGERMITDMTFLEQKLLKRQVWMSWTVQCSYGAVAG